MSPLANDGATKAAQVNPSSITLGKRDQEGNSEKTLIQKKPVGRQNIHSSSFAWPHLPWGGYASRGGNVRPGEANMEPTTSSNDRWTG